MRHGKTVDAIIRELNALIVQAEETAGAVRQCLQVNEGAAAFYAPFWQTMAEKAQEMARQLGRALERFDALSPYESAVSARFMLIKAIEDAAFLSSVTAFHAGLTMARAKPGHREAFLPLCERYDRLAQRARLGAERMAGLFEELAARIVQDMREEARRRLNAAAEAGRAAVRALSEDESLPYGYIAGELQALADELEKTPLEALTLGLLEDMGFRLEIIALAAGTDALRAPAHTALFEGISAFRERIGEAAEFFQSLPEGAVHPRGERQPIRTEAKKYADLAFQGSILLFYLRGEVQKLGTLADEAGRTALQAACDSLDRMIRLCSGPQETGREIQQALQSTDEKLTRQAERLGEAGGALRFIAQQVERAAALCG